MRNIGAAAATGEILGFVDADVYLVPQWANHCVAQLQQRCDAVINSVTWSEADAGGCTGTCVLQRWLFERVNGFNENLDAAWGYEDTDLLVRLQRAGGRVGSYPVSMVRHINHGDDLRQCHFIGKRQARAPGTFMQHLDTCRRDAEVHCYEANRVRRLTFPTPEITQIVRSEEI